MIADPRLDQLMAGYRAYFQSAGIDVDAMLTDEEGAVSPGPLHTARAMLDIVLARRADCGDLPRALAEAFLVIETMRHPPEVYGTP